MKRFVSLGFLMAALPAAVTILPAAETAPPSAEALDYFEKKVRPLLMGKCYNCHSADNKAAGGLRVDDRNGILQGGGRGPAVVPGDIEKSVLLKAISHTDDKLKMPPEFKLADEEIAILTQWVKDGAAWPAIEVPAELLKDDAEYDKLRQEHWAWQPLKSPAVPVVKDTSWPRNEIDQFLLSSLEQHGLSPVPAADRLTLLRRVTFDLTGLPPSPEEVLAYEADQSAEAYERVVDRLLQSPAFGERWGRHWLDVARYAESTGSARNLPYPQAWRYRDYVIDSFNKDKPYDQFIREQIAGDLLLAENDAQRQEQLVATGFLALGVKDVNQRFKVRFTMDNIDEQIDTVTRSVLAVTASCARCHDHKFDPVSTKEYYALAGIFHSTDLCSGLRNKMGGGGLDYYDPKMLILLSQSSKPDPEFEAKIEKAKVAADEAKAAFEELRDSPAGAELAPNGRPKRQVARQKWNRAQAEYVALTDPAAQGEVALGVRESQTIGDTEIRVRGEAEKLGPVVPRGFLKIVNLPETPAIPEGQSGRLQLAQWLTTPQNPLTSRVIVNRVWQHLFGAGLVSTVDNFGVTGDKPSHPELLDYLAAKFIEDGWSIKRLTRRIVLTRAYQLSTAADEQALVADPMNRYSWRHSPRRLSAEELRDATLAASSQIDRSRQDRSPAHDLRVIELRNNGPEAQRLSDIVSKSRKRSVYLPLLRTLVPSSLEVFDFADQGTVTGSRDTTTVPTQALYQLNDIFVRRGSLALAQTLTAESAIDDKGRIERVYLLSVGRTPTAVESERALAYLTEFETLAAQELAGSFAATTAEMSGEVAVPATPEPAKATPELGTLGQAQSTATVANPDDIEQATAATPEEVVQPRTAREAAWASFIQAIYGSGEFQYLR